MAPNNGCASTAQPWSSPAWTAPTTRWPCAKTERFPPAPRASAPTRAPTRSAAPPARRPRQRPLVGRRRTPEPVHRRQRRRWPHHPDHARPEHHQAHRRRRRKRHVQRVHVRCQHVAHGDTDGRWRDRERLPQGRRTGRVKRQPPTVLRPVAPSPYWPGKRLACRPGRWIREPDPVLQSGVDGDRISPARRRMPPPAAP